MTSQLDKLGAITSPWGLWEAWRIFMTSYLDLFRLLHTPGSFSVFCTNLKSLKGKLNEMLNCFRIDWKFLDMEIRIIVFFRGLIDDGHETFYVMPEIGHEASLTEIQMVTSVEFRWTVQEFSSLHLPIHNIVKILIVCIVFG